MSVRVPECQKIKNSELDQYDDEPFEQRQCGTAGVEGVNVENMNFRVFWAICSSVLL